jgi:chemotaxis response regulator CheB
MSVQEQSLIGRPKITPIRMLLANDSEVSRRVPFVFLEREPLLEIIGEAKDFRELLEKALALKPRIVLMDLQMRDKYKFKPEFVRSELQASAEHVFSSRRPNRTPRQSRQNLDHCAVVDIGKTRTGVELIHQSCAQLQLNMRRTLMEMV